MDDFACSSSHEHPPFSLQILLTGHSQRSLHASISVVKMVETIKSWVQDMAPTKKKNPYMHSITNVLICMDQLSLLHMFQIFYLPFSGQATNTKRATRIAHWWVFLCVKIPSFQRHLVDGADPLYCSFDTYVL